MSNDWYEVYRDNEIMSMVDEIKEKAATFPFIISTIDIDDNHMIIHVKITRSEYKEIKNRTLNGKAMITYINRTLLDLLSPMVLGSAIKVSVIVTSWLWFKQVICSEVKLQNGDYSYLNKVGGLGS